MKKIKVDPWYNALQVKYAYAVTCHKAQGGQWQRVFIDQGYMTEEMHYSRLFSLAIYSLYSCNRHSLFSELAQRAD